MLPPSEPDAAIEHQTMCLRCGYDLYGLAPSGLCPECGLSIAESLERRRLGLSSPEYLSTLRTGALLTIAALAFFILAGLVRWQLLHSLFAVGTQNLFVGLDSVAGTLLLSGVWMLTIDDPGLHQKDQARPNKRAMRIAAAGLLAISALEFFIAVRIPLPVPIPGTPTANSLFAFALNMGASLWTLACWLILATGLVNYTRWLAVRVPDRRLLGMTQTMSWMLPLVLVVAFGASLFFGTASRLLPLGMMGWLLGAARERMRSDQM